MGIQGKRGIALLMVRISVTSNCWCGMAPIVIVANHDGGGIVLGLCG